MRVDFYLLESCNDRLRLNFACRLTEKAYRMGHDVFICTESKTQQKVVDDLLWTFRPGSFIPHAVLDIVNTKQSPVVIGQNIDTQRSYNILLNLAPQFDNGPLQFERIIELVDQNESIRTSARQRYRRYKEQGHDLTTHQIQL